MNGFDLAGRPIRVGLGNDKFTPESTANLLRGFQGQNQQQFQGSSFSGAGGRGPQPSNFDRAGGRDNEKGTGASALDDTDVAGVNFNNYSRDALMRKLARTDEPNNGQPERQILKPKTETKPLPVNVSMASRCVVLHNMFDPAEYVVTPLFPLDTRDANTVPGKWVRSGPRSSRTKSGSKPRRNMATSCTSLSTPTLRATSISSSTRSREERTPSRASTAATLTDG